MIVDITNESSFREIKILIRNIKLFIGFFQNPNKIRCSFPLLDKLGREVERKQNEKFAILCKRSTFLKRVKVMVKTKCAFRGVFSPW